MRDTRHSNFVLLDVFDLNLFLVPARRLSHDICCCTALCVLNATQTVFIEVWSYELAYRGRLCPGKPGFLT